MRDRRDSGIPSAENPRIRPAKFVKSLLLAAGVACSVHQQGLNAYADHFPDPFSDSRSPVFVDRGIQLISAEELISNEFPSPAESSQNALADDVPATNETEQQADRLFRKAIPANKMVVRRDPPANRFIGNEGENGQSIRDVQTDLLKTIKRDNPFAALPLTQSSQAGWVADQPYGKYIYIHHSPLFFEDIPVERYGDESHPCLTPVISFTKFMGTALILPYKVTTDYWAAHHNDACFAFDYQGNMRPGILEGRCIPDHQVIREYPMANFAGIAVQTGVIFGGLAMFP